MLLYLENLFDDQALAFVDDVLANAQFVDGGATAGADAGRIKRNQEMDRAATPKADLLETLVVRALQINPDFGDHVLPRNFSRPIVSRYADGMEYGLHVDNPLMGMGGGLLRTDVSVTLFLADPDSYDGGALELEIEGQRREIKLPRGHAVAYTTGTPHRVTPVTRGARIAAVLWAESIVADPHKRRILSDFQRTSHMMVERHAGTPEADLFLKGYYDLMRLWAQP